MKYTVLLMRPDYVGDYPETYMTHVVADGVLKAQSIAQIEAARADADPDEITEGSETEILATAADYSVLLVIEGHHFDKSIQE